MTAISALFIYFSLFHVLSMHNRFAGVAAGTLGAVRASIADYQVQEAWARPGRYVCRPPDRLGRPGPVLVTELRADAEGWPQLSEHLVRLASVPGGRLLEPIEVGPDLETGRVFLVTEPADPAWPDDRTDPTGPDPERPAVATADAVEAVVIAARGAHDLHEVGLPHGSIHPDTILRAERGVVLDLPILDGPPGEIARTGPWSRLAATSPELLAGEPPSRRSDIWALGATLHILLSPHPLFPGLDGDEPVTAVQRIMFTRPEIDRSLPDAVAEVISACLAPDGADRPPTAADVADRLAAVEPGPDPRPVGSGPRTDGEAG
jgi:eukaryotic-like serine/threonine-protein kinase